MLPASFRPLASRNFALVWSAALVSNVGTWMQIVTLGIVVTAKTHEPGWTGLVAAAAFLPNGLLAPLGGALADRLDRRRWLIVTTIAEAAFAGALAALAFTGHELPWLLSVVAFLGGTASAIGFPTYQAMLPDLVDKKDLLAAVSLSSAQFNLGRVIGPALAGVALVAGSAGWAFTANAISFGAVVVALLLVRLPAQVKSAGEGIVSRMREGSAARLADSRVPEPDRADSGRRSHRVALHRTRACRRHRGVPQAGGGHFCARDRPGCRRGSGSAHARAPCTLCRTGEAGHDGALRPSGRTRALWSRPFVCLRRCGDRPRRGLLHRGAVGSQHSRAGARPARGARADPRPLHARSRDDLPDRSARPGSARRPPGHPRRDCRIGGGPARHADRGGGGSPWDSERARGSGGSLRGAAGDTGSPRYARGQARTWCRGTFGRVTQALADERTVEQLARRIAELGGRQRARVFHLSWWTDRLLAASMYDPEFRARLFRFVDAFPALNDDADIEAHLRDEFEGADVPTWFGAGLGIAEWVPGGTHLSAAVARRTIDRMAQQFIIGTDPAETAEACSALWRRHTAATVDVLGEHTHSEAEADRYASDSERSWSPSPTASESWPVDDLLEADDLGRVPKASVSVKVTALAPSFTMLTAEQGLEQATRRLLPVLEIASSQERLGLVRHGELRGQGAHPRAFPQAPRAARDERPARRDRRPGLPPRLGHGTSSRSRAGPRSQGPAWRPAGQGLVLGHRDR